MPTFIVLSRKSFFVLSCLLCMTLVACAAGPTTNATKTTATGTPTLAPAQPLPAGEIDASWVPLVQRLQADKVSTELLSAYFSNLPPSSAEIMGTKIKELYRNAYGIKRPVDPNAPPPSPPSKIYRSIVTAANMERCKEFLATHQQYFDGMEKKHGVPRNIVVALMLMETSLGRQLGNQNAFWSLASMAAATTPDFVSPAVTELTLADKQEWLQTKLTDKSTWAYKELKALITHCSVQNIDPKGMPGSVYGAIGMCQFMPSNLVPYGDDGDGDGVVNLFAEPDAIYSVGKYLSGHGWKGDMSVAQQRQAIKRYNNHNRYANTILTMAESITTGVLQTDPPDAEVKVATVKSGKKGAGKAGKKASAPAKVVPAK